MANVEFSEAQKEKLKKYNLLLKNDIKEIIENGIKLEDNIFAFDIKNNKSIVKNIKKDWTQDLAFSKDGMTCGFNIISSYRVEKNLFIVDFNKLYLSVRNLIDSIEIQ